MINRYPRNFWIICIALLFFMISFNLILPEMNQFLTDLGGANLKGLIFVFFTLSSAIARPFSGKLSDTIGRKKVMLFGMGIAVVISLLYPLFNVISIFFLLRFGHGFSAGFLPTGATAMVTDLLPSKSRGMGMGIWGTFSSLGIGIGQFFGSPIRSHLGMVNLFLIAALFAVACGLLIAFVKETLPDTKPFSWSSLSVKWSDVFEKSVLPPAIVMFLSAVSSGILFVLAADISDFLHIDNKGWFFGIYVISTISIRLFASSLSDVIGRRKTLLIGMILMTISMTLVAFSRSSELFTISAVLFGITTGISSPTLFAWTADLSHPDRRGVGAGTLFIALELGIMTGSFGTMAIYDNSLNSVPYVCAFGAVLSILAVLYLVWNLSRRTSIT